MDDLMDKIKANRLKGQILYNKALSLRNSLGDSMIDIKAIQRAKAYWNEAQRDEAILKAQRLIQQSDKRG